RRVTDPETPGREGSTAPWSLSASRRRDWSRCVPDHTPHRPRAARSAAVPTTGRALRAGSGQGVEGDLAPLLDPGHRFRALADDEHELVAVSASSTVSAVSAIATVSAVVGFARDAQSGVREQLPCVGQWTALHVGHVDGVRDVHADT